MRTVDWSLEKIWSSGSSESLSDSISKASSLTCFNIVTCFFLDMVFLYSIGNTDYELSAIYRLFDIIYLISRLVNRLRPAKEPFLASMTFSI